MIERLPSQRRRVLTEKSSQHNHMQDDFLAGIVGLTIKKDFKKFPNSIFFFKGDYLLMQQNLISNHMLFSYDKFWTSFQEFYHIDNSELTKFVIAMTHKYFGAVEFVEIEKAYYYSDDIVNKHFQKDSYSWIERIKHLLRYLHISS